MSHRPNKENLPSDAEDEEDLWMYLPDPVLRDAEDDWGKEHVRKDEDEGSGEGLEGQEAKHMMVHLSVREWDGEEQKAEVVRRGVPEARLSIDDLRVAVDGDGTRAGHAGGGADSVRWVLFAALTVVVVLGGTLVCMSVLSSKNPTVNPLGIQPLVIEQLPEDPKNEMIVELLGRQDEARRLIKQFAQAGSVVEQRSLVRDVPGVDVLILENAKPWNESPGWNLPQDARWEVQTDVEPLFGMMTWHDAAERKVQAFYVLEDGKLSLDWEATTGHGTVPFSGLVTGRGDASKVRVRVGPASFYPAVYPEEEYACFRIFTQIDDVPVWGFARRSTVAERELSGLFHKSMFGGEVAREAMVLLSLDRGPEGSAPNQWLIIDVLHKSWVAP